MVAYPPTNELFVADGYGNHRVVVFDADNGAFKRMWGAFSNSPENDDQCPYRLLNSVPNGPGPSQFSIVHAIRVSNDGLVYVADRENRRVQVFSLEGEYLDQIVWPEEPFALNPALLTDSAQQFLYVGGGGGIMVLDRHSLGVLSTIETTVGTGHQIQVNSVGNLYIVATGLGYERLIIRALSSEIGD
jgi:DNA-binding beta-propeller fold protein YncE